MARVRVGSIDTSLAGRVQGEAITPERIAAMGTEHAHQCAVFQWVALTGRKHLPELDLLFAIPNGGDRRPSVAAAMKAEGVKSGVPDLCLPVARQGSYGDWSHSLWIELKLPGRERERDGGRSESQVAWHKRLVSQGNTVVLAFGWMAVVGALNDYLVGNQIGNNDADGVIWRTAFAGLPIFSD